ncbi:SDR family oxidoreductase [Paenibacillus sp. GCM10027627]|uniref:SDR family oxidoreductase n=1 Tax=unclassified Paenibacillus TaxID=185978 RepID=UPI0036366CE2
MIVVIGASGTIGKALLESLNDKGAKVRAVSRQPELLRQELGSYVSSDAESHIMMGDASDRESLRRAFAGADQLFLVLSNSPRQVEWETSIIEEAALSGIKHIVKISSPVFQASAPVAVAGWHGEIEKALERSGMDYTILRPYAFMQNLFHHVPAIKARNAFFGTMGEAACNFVDGRDIADVAAEVLTNREVQGGIYTLTGAETFSYPQIADQLSRLLGRNIEYVNLDSLALYQQLTELAGMPPWIARHVVEIQAMARMVPEGPTGDVQRLLGREPRTLDAFLREHIGKFD